MGFAVLCEASLQLTNCS